MDKLKQMKTFMLTVELGSMVKAAQQLFITKAAASKQIAELEKSLNVQLLHRTTRQLRPTVAGQLYYDSLAKVFASISEAENVVNQAYHKPKGILRVTSHRYFGEKFIVKNLKEFISLYPEIKIDLELADRFPDLEKEEIDVLCGVGREGPGHLIRKRVLSAYHMLCASPRYLKQFGIPKSPYKLKKHRYITHSFREPDNVLTFRNDLQVSVDYHVRVNDAQAMLQCALNGVGFVKIYNYFVEEYIKNGKLVEVLPEYREPKKSIYIFYQPHKYMQTKIRLFIDFLCRKVNPNCVLYDRRFEGYNYPHNNIK